ncbi:MAG: ATP-binding protein, partial [Halanaerobium sp.]
MQNSKVEKNFTINCRAAEISPLLKKLFLEINNLTAFTEEMKFNLEIAAREMLANAIEHGCALASENGRNLEKLRVEITLRIEGKTLTFKVKDPGPGFDWENYDLKTMPKFEE